MEGTTSLGMTLPQIKSLALYPSEQGVAWIKRRAGANYPVVGDWPELIPGMDLEVVDTSAWKWRVTVLEATDDMVAKVQVQGEKEALPLPTIKDGALRLPNLSGHAHLRTWSRGDIVSLPEGYFKVTKAKTDTYGSNWLYEFQPSTAEAYATRAGRVSFPSESSLRGALDTAVKTESGEWLHITKMSRTAFGSAIGRSYSYWGNGKYVPEEKAKKINAVHPRLLDTALSAIPGERVPTMPEGAVQLKPKTSGSLAASGTRVAVVGKTIYHERVGDPDMADSWHHYVIRFEAPELLATVKAYMKKAAK